MQYKTYAETVRDVGFVIDGRHIKLKFLNKI